MERTHAGRIHPRVNSVRLGMAVVAVALVAVAATTQAGLTRVEVRAGVSLAVTPTSVRRGGWVRVHGAAGGCPAGDTVTLLSRAFASSHSFAGVPAVYAQVGSAGRFSARTRIPRARRLGTYGITARCGGGNLGVQAHLTVTR